METPMKAQTKAPTKTLTARPPDEGFQTPPAALRWTLASLSLSMLLSSLGTSIANIGLPALTVYFSASYEQVQWVVLAYLLALTGLIVVVGRLGDLFGRRCLLLAGIALFGLASAACGMAASLPLLVAARAAQGLGAAAMMALSVAIVGEAVPKTRSGTAMGLLGTMSAVGTALGPSLGGLLLANFGWRALFLVQMPLALAALLLAGAHLPTDRPAPAQRTRLRLSLLREGPRLAGLANAALVAAVMMGTFVVGPFHLARAVGLAPAQVGLAMACGPLVAALGGIPAGRLVDRLGAARVGLIGLALMGVGCLALACGPAVLAAYVAPLAILTAGYSLFQTANNTGLMADVPGDQRGLVSGLMSLARNLGLIAGASGIGAVFALAGGESAESLAVAHGTHAAFAVAGALVVIASILAVMANRRRR